MFGPELQILIVTVLFLGLLTAGMAVPFAIAVPAVIYLLMQGGFTALNGLGLMSWGSMNTFALTAVPLFMFMADILSVSGLSNRIYNGLAKLVAPLPGGLLQTNIAGCAIFASVSGSSIATAASIGGVALPQLTSRSYNRALAAGSLAAGGTLGILIPPSFPMIIYGTFTETSVPKLFIAGVIPGLIMTALFMIYIGIHALIVPSVAPKEQGARNMREVLRAVADILPFVVLIAGTLGGLYFGVVTTTEAAVIGCFLSILLGYLFGDLTLKKLIEAMHSTVNFTGNILFLIFAAYIFSYAISFAGIGEKLTEFIVGMKLTTLQFYLVLFALFTVLGCLIESLGMIVITVPLLFPILGRYGIDPILFGVVLVIYIELGQISPPIGINLFVIQSIWDGKLSEVVYGTIPFHLIMFVVLAMVIFWPELALWLPQHMSGK
jgi:C4-dicarboxylate transporter, DctM subunit